MAGIQNTQAVLSAHAATIRLGIFLFLFKLDCLLPWQLM